MPFIFMPFFLAMLVLGGGFILASRFLRAYEQRQSDPREIQELRDRIARLEDTLESTNTEMRRLSEAQHFTTRLLEGRTDRPAPPG